MCLSPVFFPLQVCLQIRPTPFLCLHECQFLCAVCCVWALCTQNCFLCCPNLLQQAYRQASRQKLLPKKPKSQAVRAWLFMLASSYNSSSSRTVVQETDTPVATRASISVATAWLVSFAAFKGTSPRHNCVSYNEAQACWVSMACAGKKDCTVANIHHFLWVVRTES